MWDGANPQSSANDGMLRMSGVPLSWPRSTRGFQPLAKPVTGFRPIGSRSLTLSSYPQLAAQQVVWRGYPQS
jgi:hypothetical protein